MTGTRATVIVQKLSTNAHHVIWRRLDVVHRVTFSMYPFRTSNSYEFGINVRGCCVAMGMLGLDGSYTSLVLDYKTRSARDAARVTAEWARGMALAVSAGRFKTESDVVEWLYGRQLDN